MILGIDSKTWLTFTVLGSFIATLGSLLGILLKDYFFSRSMEKLKQKQLLEALYQKYCDPLRLSALELVNRLLEIAKSYPTVFLTKNVFDSSPTTQQKNSNEDPYYKRYKLMSTLYRFCAFLGWLELYRQDITYLNPGSSRKSRELEKAIHLIREDLADGHINTAADWEKWRDVLVFREELRAIGESMIEVRASSRTIIGYGRFLDLLDATGESSTKKWAHTLLNLFLDLQVKQDFRQIRLQRLVVHLVDLLVLIEQASVEQYLVDARNKWSPVLNNPL